MTVQVDKKTLANAWARAVASKHLGANIKKYRWTTWVSQGALNVYGSYSNVLSCTGTVVEIGEMATLFKLGPTEFKVVETDLLCEPVQLGDKVQLHFYKLKRFDGTAADGCEDPAVGGCKSVLLTGAQSQFPVRYGSRFSLNRDLAISKDYPEIKNPYLQDLIRQMENLPLNDGIRQVVNVLTDANPTDLQFNDPEESDSAIHPPSIQLRVKTAKFVGVIKIGYDRGSDTYFVELAPDQAEPKKLEWIHFNDMGAVLIEHVDDGSWNKVQVEIIKRAAKPRKALEALAA